MYKVCMNISTTSCDPRICCIPHEGYTYCYCYAVDAATTIPQSCETTEENKFPDIDFDDFIDEKSLEDIDNIANATLTGWFHYKWILWAELRM